MSNIISAVSAVTNIYSLIAFILLLAVFVLMKLRIIEQRLFQRFAILFIVSLLAISFWMIYQTQTKQGEQHQASPPVSQQPTQTAVSTGNASLQANQIILNQTGGQTSIVIGDNKVGDSSVPTQIKQPLPKQPFHEKETKTAERAKNPVISKHDSGSVQRKRKAPSLKINTEEEQVKIGDLVWQKNIESHVLTWPKAQEYCINLELGGYSDWRLPTIGELASLIDKRYSPSKNPLFGALPANYPPYFWSSSIDPNDNNEAQFLNFKNGLPAQIKKEKGYGFVRCARQE